MFRGVADAQQVVFIELSLCYFYTCRQLFGYGNSNILTQSVVISIFVVPLQKNYY